MGGKKGKKIKQLKWPKYQKPKDENMGWRKQICPKINLPSNLYQRSSPVGGKSLTGISTPPR
jgi:hypothetical protein